MVFIGCHLYAAHFGIHFLSVLFAAYHLLYTPNGTYSNPSATIACYAPFPFMIGIFPYVTQPFLCS